MLAMLSLIPYYPQPSWHLVGPFTVHAFGALVAVAILFGAWIVRKRLAKRGLPVEPVGDFIFFLMVAGFVGAHLTEILLYQPHRVLEEPWVLLKVWDGISSYGGFFGALLGAWWWLRRQPWGRYQRWTYLEEIAFGLPFGWLFGRLGCFSAHDHIGISSTFFLAVDFPANLGGPRLDLGLIEAIYTLGIIVLWLVLSRKERPVGFFLALLPAVYAPVRFGLDFLREGDRTYLGLTPAQYASMAVIGLAFWVYNRRPLNDASSAT